MYLKNKINLYSTEQYRNNIISPIQTKCFGKTKQEQVNKEDSKSQTMNASKKYNVIVSLRT